MNADAFGAFCIVPHVRSFLLLRCLFFECNIRVPLSDQRTSTDHLRGVPLPIALALPFFSAASCTVGSSPVGQASKVILLCLAVVKLVNSSGLVMVKLVNSPGLVVIWRLPKIRCSASCRPPNGLQSSVFALIYREECCPILEF